MKARQQAAETINSNSEETQAASQPAEPVVFDGGFFQVESPARPAGEREPFQRPTLICCWKRLCHVSRLFELNK